MHGMADQQYLGLLRDVLANGVYKMDRTGTGTYSVFGRELRFDLTEGFPALTTKKINMNLITTENLWFLNGMTNIRYLLQHKNTIWVEWAIQKYFESGAYEGPDMTDFGRRAASDPTFREQYKREEKTFIERVVEDGEFADRWGDLGPVYGAQWRNYGFYDPYTGEHRTVDQLAEAISLIKHNPDSRRILVVAWHPGYLPYQALPPCHYAFQFYVSGGRLSCKFEMRSTDVFLGLPFNIAGYALITHLMAKECGLEVGELIYSGGDVHIYANHLNQVKEQLQREPRALPALWLNPSVSNIFDYKPEDVKLIGYDPHPTIKAPVAV